MKIYVAGPYSSGNLAENARAAITAGNYVSLFGHTPFIPHLGMFWELLYPHSYEFWMSQDIEWLRCCDALLRLPGYSPGADREEAIAKEMGIPIYYSELDIPRGEYQT